MNQNTSANTHSLTSSLQANIVGQNLLPNDTWLGHPVWRIRHAKGQLTISQLGGQVLSWIPTNQVRDVFWVSKGSKAPALTLRGGIPICWPWFAKQNMPSFAPQHGLVRQIHWQIDHWSETSDVLRLELSPDSNWRHNNSQEFAQNLELKLLIELSDQLTLQMQTTNKGDAPFQLTQAMHSYFAVSHAKNISIDGILNKPYLDKLEDFASKIQNHPFGHTSPCDRIYHQLDGEYGLFDPEWKRQISIQTQGSQSLVVWNPGESGMSAFKDMSAPDWRDFYCLEAANASPNHVILQSGQTHSLTQTISVTSV